MSTLRKWFGPSKEEVWRQLCDETGARFVDGGFWKGEKVVAAHGQWTILLDTYAISTGKVTVVFTRLRAPYINPDGFRFKFIATAFSVMWRNGLGCRTSRLDMPISIAIS